MDSLFYGCSKLTSVDLSNFNTSKVYEMSNLFYSCTNLKNINFGNINTPSLETLKSAFNGCSELTSIDLSNFNTKKVKSMEKMFYECRNLKYLDLSNFDTSKITAIYSMFYGCTSLIYLNLYSFKFGSYAVSEDIFYGLSSKVKYCIQDAETKTLLLDNNKISDCDDICFKKYVKLDDDNNCVEDLCLNPEYKYIYKDICYNECPKDTYDIFCEGDNCDINKRECLDEKPQGYFLDKNIKKYKKCFRTCKYCSGEGNERNNNCIECAPNLVFIKESSYKTNCCENCNYKYYFDEFNEFHCTQTCPTKYNKFIPDKNKCIDNCENDEIYRYEFDNICYDKEINKIIPSNDNYIYPNIKSSDQKLMDTIFIIDKSDIRVKIKDLIFNYSQNNNNESLLVIQEQILENIQKLFISGIDFINIGEDNEFFLNIDKVNYFITTTSNQKNKEKNNTLNINFGDCENLLKEKYNISTNDSLYILIVDILVDNIRKIEYELYYPFTTSNFTRLDLSLCKNYKIDISIPFIIPINEIDKYNKSSAFYNDLCYTLTSESGTDKILKDRQNEYITNNMSICEEDCDFTHYDDKTNKALCSCYIKMKLPMISEIKVDKKKLISNFKNIKNIGNFKVLNCLYLLYNLSNIFKNYANYIVIILFILSLISIFIFTCYDSKKIKNYILNFQNKLNKNEKKKKISFVNNKKGNKKNKSKAINKNILFKNKKIAKQKSIIAQNPQMNFNLIRKKEKKR